MLGTQPVRATGCQGNRAGIGGMAAANGKPHAMHQGRSVAALNPRERVLVDIPPSVSPGCPHRSRLDLDDIDEIRYRIPGQFQADDGDYAATEVEPRVRPVVLTDGTV